MFEWIETKSQLFVALFASITIVVVSDIGALNVCGPTLSDETSSSLVFVSTLDGKLTALDVEKNGEEKWSLDFDDGPMLSSRQHGRELNNDGQWIRMIPSLNGGLYVFDGENVKAIPVSTDELLRSSFRYSEDVIFSGGKETRSYGVSSSTGKVLYQCNINGCTNNTEGDTYAEQDVLIVQRFQQTVRAVEPRTGQEKWNFSVGQYEVESIPKEDHDCNDRLKKIMEDIELKVIVPEGLVWAINKTNPNVKLWQYKFDSPIVSIWREGPSVDDGKRSRLKSVNLFESTDWIWGSKNAISPSIYIGMHEQQLYIQENVDLVNAVGENRRSAVEPKIFPWRPYPASETAVTIVDDPQKSTAASILYNTEYSQGNGFYLHTKEYYEHAKKCNKTDPKIALIESAAPGHEDLSNEEDERRIPVQEMSASLSNYWVEILLITISSTLLFNWLLGRTFFNAFSVTTEAILPPFIVERHIETKQEVNTFPATQENNSDYKSRYLTDFEPIDCLGKGGYGVVFEAKNKIDDCNYAIKRIALPNSQDSRERVMREVKALAKLDHHNIVRYFNAWLECPPTGWQESHDKVYFNKLNYSPSGFLSETSISTKPNGDVCIDVPSSRSSVDSAFEAVELNRANDDDSYIVFESSNASESNDPDEIDEETDISSNDASKNNNEVFVNDANEDSESIVFQNNSLSCANSNHNSGSIVTGNNRLGYDKSERDRRKASFSLDFTKKTSSKKSPKMLLYIQMQLCQRLSLRDWLKNQSGTRDRVKIVNIFQQIVDAVEYVHLKGLIHRDLKPSNIFFALDEKIKVGDFGLVTAMTEGYQEPKTPNTLEDDSYETTGIHTACVGTHLYMSPEQTNGQVYNYKVDIYSLGIILFELLIPFSTEMERVTALSNLRKSIYPHDFEVNHREEYNTLKIMLDVNPGKRPTTLGIKDRAPLCRIEVDGSSDNVKWHFELPPMSRHSSVTGSSSSGESWENIS